MNLPEYKTYLYLEACYQPELHFESRIFIRLHGYPDGLSVGFDSKLTVGNHFNDSNFRIRVQINVPCSIHTNTTYI